MKRRPCGREIFADDVLQDCPYDRAPGRQMCRWHLLLKASPDERTADASARLAASQRADGYEYRSRVPKALWPAGERWCSGCQSFVPQFYVQGSRCKGCASAAAHAQHIEKTYDITAEEYQALLEIQGNRCYVCQRVPRLRRLAVDHDHKTGAVRGLLCANDERGCNHAVLGNFEGLPGGPLAAAERLVEYLENPPMDRVRRRERVLSKPLAQEVNPVKGPPPEDAPF